MMLLPSGGLIALGGRGDNVVTSFELDGTIRWTATLPAGSIASARIDSAGVLALVASGWPASRSLSLVSLDGRILWSREIGSVAVGLERPSADRIAVIARASIQWLTGAGALVRECPLDPRPSGFALSLITAAFPDGSVAAVLKNLDLESPTDDLLVRMNDQCEVLWRRSFDHRRYGTTQGAAVSPDGSELVLLGAACSDGQTPGRTWIRRHGDKGAIVAEHGLGAPMGFPIALQWASPTCLLAVYRDGIAQERTGLVGIGEPGAECGFGP
jgi:hypothetical protein